MGLLNIVNIGVVTDNCPRHGGILPPPRLVERLHQLHRHAEVPAEDEGQRPPRHGALQVSRRNRENGNGLKCTIL